MTDPGTHEAQLRLQILQALEDAPAGHDLADLHILLCRPRRDASILPAMSALIGSGCCEKVQPDPAWAQEPSHRGEPAPVRFRLTAAGRALLHSGPSHRSPGRPAPSRAPLASPVG